MSRKPRHGRLWRGAPRKRAPRVQLSLLEPTAIECEQASSTDTWCTPPEIWKPCLELAGGDRFGLDAATNIYSTVPALVKLTPAEDALSCSWDPLAHADLPACFEPASLWLNPPYSTPHPWIDRWLLADLFLHRFLLVKVATGTKWWQPLWRRPVRLILFFRGRQRFLRPQGPATSAPFDSALIYAGPEPHALADAFAKTAHAVFP